MKQIIKHDVYGEIVYDESFWTGKKMLSIDGAPLERVSKKEFKLKDGSIVTVTGSFLYGATLNINSEAVRLTPKIKWYEIVLAILPFFLVLTWGNIPTLCAIVPVVGGAVGGGIGGLCSILGLLGIRSVKPIWLKILIGLACLAATFGICAGIGYAIISAFR